jgi:hypothetical protein
MWIRSEVVIVCNRWANVVGTRLYVLRKHTVQSQKGSKTSSLYTACHSVATCRHQHSLLCWDLPSMAWNINWSRRLPLRYAVNESFILFYLFILPVRNQKLFTFQEEKLASLLFLSDWLQAGRSRGWSSSTDKVKIFLHVVQTGSVVYPNT